MKAKPMMERRRHSCYELRTHTCYTYVLFPVSASEVWLYSSTGVLKGSRVTSLGSGSVETEYPPSANDPGSFPRRKLGEGKMYIGES